MDQNTKQHNTKIKSNISLNLTTILSDLRRCALVHSLSPDSSIFVQPQAAQPTSAVEVMSSV